MTKHRILQIIFIILFLFTFTKWVTAPLALIIGFLFTNIFGHPLPQLSGKVTSKMLKGSIIGLGFGMSVESALEAGANGFLLTVCSITLVLTLGYFVGKALKMPRKLSHLTASGTAICGGSAIAAVASAIDAKDSDVSISLGVIFLLNSIALFLFPALGHLLGMSQGQFGLWSAIAIHDTSSVVGAASAYGEEALQIATTVKLARALWIIPVSLLSLFLFKSKGSKITIPWFIFLFVAAIILNSYLSPEVQHYTIYIYKFCKSMLVATLFLIGASLSFKSIKEVGAKPLILGIILWTVVSISTLLVIMNY